MKRSARRSPFVLSLLFSLALFGCLVLAEGVKQPRPRKPSVKPAKTTAQHARAKRNVARAPQPTPSQPAPANQQSAASTVGRSPELPEAYDSPAEAAEFFRLKRLPADASQLPIEKYFEAQEQMRLMPQYSTATARHLRAPR